MADNATRKGPGRAFDDFTVMTIREAHAEGVSRAELAKIYGLSTSAVSDIVTGRSYARTPGPVRERRGYLHADASPEDFRAEATRRLLRGRAVSASGCWLWSGAVDGGGYGLIRVGPFDGKVHRLAYLLAIGPIPTDLVVDHACHSFSDCPGGRMDPCRRCFRPSHLRLVTNAENVRAGRAGALQRARTHCPRGHAYDSENTKIVVVPSGFGRICRTCVGQRRAIRKAERQ